MHPLVEVFAANVRHLRRAAGLTQLELAKHLGCSSDYVRRLEAGSRGATLEHVAFAADLFNVEPAYLFQQNDVPRRPMARGRRERLGRRVPREGRAGSKRFSRSERRGDPKS